MAKKEKEYKYNLGDYEPVYKPFITNLLDDLILSIENCIKVSTMNTLYMNTNQLLPQSFIIVSI